VDGAQAQATANPVVAVRGVHRTFDLETVPVRALRGVDLDVAAGEFVAVMGPSGCGKSTLLHLVAGLDRPDDGDVVVAGTSLVGLPDRELVAIRRRHVGLVFQFFNLVDAMTAAENVAVAALLAGARRREAATRAADLLDLLGVGPKAHHLPATLSGGERQRLAIARALANEPTVLLADEPTGSLDSEGGAEVLELLRRLHRTTGQAIVLVTHDATVAAGASRIVRMRDGVVVDAGRAGTGPAPIAAPVVVVAPGAGPVPNGVGA
jgi:putative ABC transport system ATP-binding protein